VGQGAKLEIPAGALVSDQALTITASGPRGNPVSAFDPAGTTLAFDGMEAALPR